MRKLLVLLAGRGLEIQKTFLSPSVEIHLSSKIHKSKRKKLK